MAMDPPPHLVVISSKALIKRGCEHRDLRLPARSRPLSRNDHFGAPRYAFRPLRPLAPALPAGRAPPTPARALLVGRSPPPPASAPGRLLSPVVRTPHNSAPSGRPRRRSLARDRPHLRVSG